MTQEDFDMAIAKVSSVVDDEIGWIISILGSLRVCA